MNNNDGLFLYVPTNQYDFFINHLKNLDMYLEKIAFVEKPDGTAGIYTHGREFANFGTSTIIQPTQVPVETLTEQRVREIILSYFDNNDDGEINSEDMWGSYVVQYYAHEADGTVMAIFDSKEDAIDYAERKNVSTITVNGDFSNVIYSNGALQTPDNFD